MHGDKGFGVGREGKALQVNTIERAEIDTNVQGDRPVVGIPWASTPG